MNAATQGMTIAYMMLSGAAMGLVFDLYRVTTHRFQLPRWMLPGLDLIYWAAAALGVFSILLRSNQGEVRMYVFLGLGIGVTGYFGLMSKWIIRLSDKLLKYIILMFQMAGKVVNHMLLIPILWIIRSLAKLLDVIFVITAALVLMIGKLALKPIRAIGRWLWVKMLPIRRRFRPVIQAFSRMKEIGKQIRQLIRKKP